MEAGRPRFMAWLDHYRTLVHCRTLGLHFFNCSKRMKIAIKKGELPRWCRRCVLDPWIGKNLWSRKRQPAPVFLPIKSMDRGAW